MGETPLFHVERLRDLKQSLWIALIFIFLRGCMNRITKKKLEATRKKRGLKVEVDKLQEEIWLVVCGTLFSICSGYLISNSPNFKGCNLFKTSECYAAFTTATGDVPKEIKIYYLTEVGTCRLISSCIFFLHLLSNPSLTYIYFSLRSRRMVPQPHDQESFWCWSI